jgi:hypothetical protein
VEGYSGREHVVLFEEVQAVEMNQPEGMVLYSPSEMRASPPLRKFVFSNNEEDQPGCFVYPCNELFCPVQVITRRSAGDVTSRFHSLCRKKRTDGASLW